MDSANKVSHLVGIVEGHRQSCRGRTDPRMGTEPSNSPGKSLFLLLEVERSRHSSDPVEHRLRSATPRISRKDNELGWPAGEVGRHCERRGCFHEHSCVVRLPAVEACAGELWRLEEHEIRVVLGCDSFQRFVLPFSLTLRYAVPKQHDFPDCVRRRHPPRGHLKETLEIDNVIARVLVEERSSARDMFSVLVENAHGGARAWIESERVPVAIHPYEYRATGGETTREPMGHTTAFCDNLLEQSIYELRAEAGFFPRTSLPDMTADVGGVDKLCREYAFR